MDRDASSSELCGKDKICLVCGDKALGYNFNAITCESCKAFFRRNALRDKEFKCPFNKKCEINTITRRFCQLCRLIKCFEIGMKKEYIMTDDDKEKKRKKIEQKRANRYVKVEDEKESEKEDDVLPKRLKVTEETNNPLNMASASSKTYQNRQSPCTSEQNVPYPSPKMEEPSSPVGSTVPDCRSPSVFNANRSRSVEIYQMSKVPGTMRPPSSFGERTSESSIIKNILTADYQRDLTPEVVDCRLVVSRIDDELSEASNSPPPLCRSPVRRPTPILSSLVNGAPERTNRRASYRPDVAEEILSDIPSTSTRADMASSMDSILTEAIKLEYEAYSSMNPRINSRELNDAERAKLNELIVANKALLAPLDDDIACMVTQEAICKGNLGSRPMLVDVLNLTAVAIRRLIKMSKKVNAFKNMCQEDQVALLKGGCTEMMILRSAMTYDPDRGSWKIPRNNESLMNIKVDVLKEAGGKVFEEHQRFLQTFEPRWRNDENIMLILSAITLFTPDRPRVVHSDVIHLEQNSYYYLLRRYLESTYPGCEARSIFLKLIQKIAELHRLNEDHVRVYMELNPEDVEPLLIEIFDLKRPLNDYHSDHD